MPTARRIVPEGGVRAGLNTDNAQIPINRIVQRDTLTDSVKRTTLTTQQPLGVSMSAIDIGVTGDIQTAGKATIEAGAAVSKGARVGSDSIGRGVTVSNPGDFVVGIADTAALQAGDVMEVTLS